MEIHNSNNESISLKEALFDSQQKLQNYVSVNQLNLDSINDNFQNYEEEINMLRAELDKRTEQLTEKMQLLQEVENNYKDTQIENKKLRQNGTSEETKIIKKELQSMSYIFIIIIMIIIIIIIIIIIYIYIYIYIYLCYISILIF